MKKIVILFIMCCHISPLFSGTILSFSINKQYYVTQTNYSPASGLSISLTHIFDSAGELGIRYTYNSMSYDIQSPSSITTVNVSAADYYLVYGYRFNTMVFSMDIKPVLGLGLKNLHRDAFNIDRGALGTGTNPGSGEIYFASIISLQVIKEITNRLSFFMEPGLSFYDTDNFKRTFSITGGIHVRLF